jgi:MoaA/NifB/PqqE/SkfB family radical SAM enzyme
MQEQTGEQISNQTEISKTEIKRQWGEYREKNDIPDALAVEVTNHCPNNCAHCYANLATSKNTKDMSISVFNNWLEVVSNETELPKQIWFCGGEPTVNKQLDQFLISASEQGFDPMIVTTGETFSNIEYCQKIVKLASEIDVTIRGFGAFHDEMMRPANSDSNLVSENHFEKTIQGLVNIADTIRENNLDTRIGLNIDIQANTDLVQIIDHLNSKNIPVDSIILQIQTFSEENKHLENIYPNNLRKPTAEIIKEYINQAKSLIESDKFNGKIDIIDKLPDDIIKQLGIEGFDISYFYNPAITPAIDPFGKLRQNVIN